MFSTLSTKTKIGLAVGASVITLALIAFVIIASISKAKCSSWKSLFTNSCKNVDWTTTTSSDLWSRSDPKGCSTATAGTPKIPKITTYDGPCSGKPVFPYKVGKSACEYATFNKSTSACDADNKVQPGSCVGVVAEKIVKDGKTFNHFGLVGKNGYSCIMPNTYSVTQSAFYSKQA
jgi:hypothetical protein